MMVLEVSVAITLGQEVAGIELDEDRGRASLTLVMYYFLISW